MSNAWDEAGQALRDSHLYVHPDAEAELEEAGAPFLDNEQDEAAELLEGASTPIWFAVLPEAAQGQQGAQQLATEHGEGTHIVLYSSTNPNNVRGDAYTFEFDNAALSSEAAQILNNSPDTFTFIETMTARLENAAENAGQNGGAAGSGTSAPSEGGGGLLPLGILLAAGGGGYLLYRRNRRSREMAQLRQVRGALDEDITAYGERLSELDLNVQANSNVPVEARREYERALDLYENAKMYADGAEKPDDLKAVTHALEEGRWLLGCVEARLNGTALPERRAPCFFDPRHGPSVEDVEWAPAGGAPRPVPACQADALRLKQGTDPDVRLVPAGDGERRPYWEAGSAYSPWAAGYFGAVLPAMMVGTMLGTTMAAPMAYGAGADAGGFGGGFGEGGGDFGGGFGDAGGDFGGGLDLGGF
ncbi:hypothetical protein EF847_18675 [Actinobacteria bacterium YIM 96077]|uniref:Uncharacterized protein n=1 Tax=Phytoactinopolyspora halophila TaxID=1981511 RepID=A0A329QHL2_9ACTN|nr:hypothetical protein [Phytoactinopolyspora halophila]AYY14414.1 hypothetical protein EF847_18675 [Actinobacteria bacterium YIM 96077]RAW11864.1 hypothetical protein DPM12_15445 [Phytoactinopolyspora halophila]